MKCGPEISTSCSSCLRSGRRLSPGTGLSYLFPGRAFQSKERQPRKTTFARDGPFLSFPGTGLSVEGAPVEQDDFLPERAFPFFSRDGPFSPRSASRGRDFLLGRAFPFFSWDGPFSPRSASRGRRLSAGTGLFFFSGTGLSVQGAPAKKDDFLPERAFSFFYRDEPFSPRSASRGRRLSAGTGLSFLFRRRTFQSKERQPRKRLSLGLGLSFLFPGRAFQSKERQPTSDLLKFRKNQNGTKQH
jgi:hypothetical protein